MSISLIVPHTIRIEQRKTLLARARLMRPPCEEWILMVFVHVKLNKSRVLLITCNFSSVSIWHHSAAQAFLRFTYWGIRGARCERQNTWNVVVLFAHFIPLLKIECARANVFRIKFCWLILIEACTLWCVIVLRS